MIDYNKKWVDEVFDKWWATVEKEVEYEEYVPEEVELAEEFINPGSTEVILKEQVVKEVVEHQWSELEKLIGWEDSSKIEPGQFPLIKGLIEQDKDKFPEIYKLIHGELLI